MRGREGVRLTQAGMADALGRELGRNIPESSVARWESGHKLAGADVYRAYIDITAAARPTDVGGVDERAALYPRVQRLDSRVARLEQALALATPALELTGENLLTVAEAAKLAQVSRQTVHNWVKAGTVRFVTQGRRLLVSRADVLVSGRLEVVEDLAFDLTTPRQETTKERRG